jgi:hypothetical protein
MGLTAHFHHVSSPMRANNMTPPTTTAVIPRISGHGQGVLCCLPGVKCEVVLFPSPVVNCLVLTVVEGTNRSVDPTESSVVQVPVITVDFPSYQNNRPC